MHDYLQQNCPSIVEIYFNYCICRLANTELIEQADVFTAIEAAVTLFEVENRSMTGHASEVSFIALFISRYLGQPPVEQNKIRLAALLHDIGKIETDENQDRHAVIGARIIRINPLLNEIADMVLYHHNSWQEKAAPGLTAGNAIPLGARIIAVADAFQNAFCRQCLRNHSDTETLRELRQRSGTDFDPELVNIVIDNYWLLSKFIYP